MKGSKPDGYYGSVYETGNKVLAVTYHVHHGAVLGRISHDCKSIQQAVYLLKNKFGIDKENITVLKNSHPVPSRIRQA